MLTDENGAVTVVHQKLRNKASEMRNEEIGSLEETRDQKMDRAHRNRRFIATVLRTYEAKFGSLEALRMCRLGGNEEEDVGLK